MSEDKREATTKERKNQKSWCGQCPVLLGRVREGRNGFHLRFYIIQSKDERHPPDRDRIEEFPQRALGRAFIEGRFVTLNVVSHSYNGEEDLRITSHQIEPSAFKLVRGVDAPANASTVQAPSSFYPPGIHQERKKAKAQKKRDRRLHGTKNPG